MKKEIYLDMDGTFVDLYGVENWLFDLVNGYPRPYIEAKPLCSLCWLSRTIHELQNAGFKVGIISWTAKNSSRAYEYQVIDAKTQWLKKHLPTVDFDYIHIVSYGTPKETLGTGYLFDDEEPNRQAWNGIAFDEKDLIKTLRKLLKEV